MMSPPKPADHPLVWSLTNREGAEESGCVTEEPSARDFVMGLEPKQAPRIVMVSELIDEAETGETEVIDGGRQEDRIPTVVEELAPSAALNVALVITVVERIVITTISRMAMGSLSIHQPSSGVLLSIRAGIP
jgi:hypothetical protein